MFCKLSADCMYSLYLWHSLVMVGILILCGSDIYDSWHQTSYYCYTSSEKLSGFPMISWGLGLISSFPHWSPHCSFTLSATFWGPRTCFSMTSSLQRWLQLQDSPLSCLNFWNRGDLLLSTSLSHLLFSWIMCYPPDLSTVSTHETILYVCHWPERLPLTWKLGKCIIGISKYPLCGGRKGKVALSHFWQCSGRIGKGKTYGHSRAELSHCRQELGAGTKHHEQDSCICTLKSFLKFLCGFNSWSQVVTTVPSVILLS